MPPRAARVAAFTATDELKAKALEVHRRLCAEYRCPIRYFSEKDPLSEIVSALLSHRTRNRESGLAYKQLRHRFGTWEAVREAPTEEVEIAIAMVTWPEQKAPRIQEVLRRITAERGELSLDFLAALPVKEARAWLARLPGVGPKTTAAVLSFSRLRMPALPVDSHHHRVAVRLALIPPTMPVDKAHDALESLMPPDWDAQQVYDHHEVFMLHGQKCCYFKGPACGRCPVLDLCPMGQGRVGGATKKAAAPADAADGAAV